MGRWREEVANRRHPPKQTRHVWINFGDDLEPLQGLVIDWRRRAYKWHALVVFLDENYEPPPLMQQWIPAEALTPVPANRIDIPRRSGRPATH